MASLTREQIQQEIQDLQNQVKAMQADPLLQDRTYRVKLRRLASLRRKLTRMGKKKPQAPRTQTGFGDGNYNGFGITDDGHNGFGI